MSRVPSSHYFLLVIVMLLKFKFVCIVAADTTSRTAFSVGYSRTFFPAAEVVALRDLYSNTSGTSWAWRPEEVFGLRWNFTQNATSGEFLHNPCGDEEGRLWQGVQCLCINQTCNVFTLDLTAYNLQGTLPSSLSHLSYIQYLILWDNSLHGTVPTSLGSLQELRVIDFDTNQFSGLLPIALTNLPQLKELWLSDNKLTGPLQPQLGKLIELELLALYGNQLTGPLLPELGDLIQLRYLYLHFNKLTGSLVPDLSRLDKLRRLHLNTNMLTGTLPSELGLLVQLNRLLLDGNIFSGVIPIVIGELVALQHLGLHINMLSGSIPKQIGQLIKLERLFLYTNILSGHLPAEINQLVQLLTLSVGQNAISGKLPNLQGLVKLQNLLLSRNILSGSLPPLLDLLVNLQKVHLFFNELTGPLPVELGKLNYLEELFLFNNHFDGAVPLELSQCTALRVLRLQSNMLSGSLDGIFTKDMVMLENLDLSDNKFSGQIPPSIFKVPNVTSIALSVNCFQGTLPSDMCFAHKVAVLSMDGLGAARHCKHSVRIPLSGVTLFNTLEGTIPSCLWYLASLKVLHLTGNGLTGSISVTASLPSSLRNISISHNKITKTVPDSIQNKDFDLLDLSFNKLTGRYSRFPSRFNATHMFLEVNRLSGRFPSTSSLLAVEALSVLRGNLFGCGSIPDGDEYSGEYTCGSEELDVVLSIFLSILVLLPACIYLFYLVVSRGAIISVSVLRLFETITNQRKYLSYLEDTEVLDVSSLFVVSNIRNFTKELQAVSKLFFIITCAHLAASVPIYGLKIFQYGVANPLYTTHSVQYRWLLSLAYVRGETSLALLLLMWVATVCVLRVILIRKGPLGRWVFEWLLQNKNDKENVKVDRKSFAQEQSKSGRWACKQVLMYLSIWLVNVSAVGSVNGFYVYLLSQSLPPSSLVGIQMLVALFKLVWNFVILPVLVRPLESTGKVVWAELRLMVINTIVIPCIATALTSPSCFQGLIVDPKVVTSSYEYEFCSLRTYFADNQYECTSYATQTVDVAPIVPPFVYNNLCSSVVLTSFIPVYILVYSAQLFVPIFYVCVFTFSEYRDYHVSLQNLIDGVFWPSHWRSDEGEVADLSNSDKEKLQATVRNRADPSQLLQANELISFDVLNYLLVFFTFGMCSPYLALIMIIAASLKLKMWIMTIGRFVHYRIRMMDDSDQMACDNNSSFNGLQHDSTIKALCTACVPVWDRVADSLWTIIVSSAVFFAFLSWDVLGDEVGWRAAVWAPLAVLGVPLCLWSTASVFDYCCCTDIVRSKDDAEVLHEKNPKYESNPLQNSKDIELF